MTELGALHYIAILVGAGMLTLVFVPLCLRVAIRHGVLDEPGGYKQQPAAVPYLGGAAIVLAFSLAVLTAAAIRPPQAGMAELAGILGGGVALAVIGLVDDIRGLPVSVRLLAMTVAALALWTVGIRVDLFPGDAANLALTLVWVVGITNAFNLLDNMDGLSAGVAGIAASAFFVIAAVNGQFLVAGLSLALVGCALGFLRHNYHPARIYMGDAGSLFLGFVLGAMGIKLQFDAPNAVTFLVPVVVLGVAIFDTTLVVLTRLAAGRNPFEGGQDHTSHRLVATGLPVPAAVGVIYLTAFALGWLGLVLSRLNDPVTAYLLFGLMLTVGTVAGVVLASSLPMATPIVGLTPMGAVLKRTFDFVAGSVLAVMATPLIVLMALASALTLRAWPFFVQKRVGRHGREFRFWKIRTMPTHAPRYGLKPEVGNIPLPRLSEFLRRRHLDELPQLYLVPAGRMSLVGPRPKMPDDFEPVDVAYAEARTRVPQGCTCLWQVGVHQSGLPSDAPEYDYWYLRHWSMRLDLWILWRTVLTLAGAGREMSLDDIPFWMVGRRYDLPVHFGRHRGAHDVDESGARDRKVAE